MSLAKVSRLPCCVSLSQNSSILLPPFSRASYSGAPSSLSVPSKTCTSVHRVRSEGRKFGHEGHSLALPRVYGACEVTAAVRRGTIARAKRKESPQQSAEEDELDEDMRTGLNEVFTEAVKVMLSEDIQALGAFKKKAEYLVEFLAEEGQVEAANFMFVVQGLLDHRVPEEYKELSGPYEKAFRTMGILLEDSGWVLRQEGEEEEEEEEEEEIDEEFLEVLQQSSR